MPIEKRTRVEIFLPLRSDLLVYKTTVDWLAEEFAYERGGATLTTPFAGLYISSSRVDIVEDAVRVLFCDLNLDCEKVSHLDEVVKHLEGVKRFLKIVLDEDEIWIVYYPICCVVS